MINASPYRAFYDIVYNFLYYKKGCDKTGKYTRYLFMPNASISIARNIFSFCHSLFANLHGTQMRHDFSFIFQKFF